MIDKNMKSERKPLTQAHVVLMIALTTYGCKEFDVRELTEIYLKSPLYSERTTINDYNSYDEFFNQRLTQVYSYLTKGYGAGVGDTTTTLGKRMYRINNVNTILSYIRVAIDCYTEELG